MTSPITRLVVLLPLLLVLVACQETPSPEKAPDSIRALLPAEAAAPWNITGGIQEVVGDDLYILINGGADIYQEYGFLRAITAQYAHPAGHQLNVEIFEMLSPASAYGIYTFKTGPGGRSVDLGADARLEDYYLNAWQNRFLITVTGFDTDPVTLQGLQDMTRHICDRLPARFDRPDLVDRCRPALADARHLTYLRGPLALLNRQPLGTPNFNRFSEGLYARVGDAAVLVLRYPTPDEAAAILTRTAAELAAAPAAGLESATDGITWRTDRGDPALCRPSGPFLLLAVGETRPADHDILDRLMKRLL
ncbi:MAG: hypothetical protein JXQ27_08740 [Acidobacteria bacterium]|nr:hypothetical protein [Acidobacteriota bacterium]